MNNKKPFQIPQKNIITPGIKQQQQQQQFQSVTFDELETIKVLYLNDSLQDLVFSTDENKNIRVPEEVLELCENLKLVIIPQIGQMDIMTVNENNKLVPLLSLKDKDIISYKYGYKKGKDKFTTIDIIVSC